MIWFFVPYSFEKKMLQAWQEYMALVPSDDDWICMMDGDIMFFQADWGHLIKEYVERYPDTGLFTCYASRSGTGYMMPKNNMMNSPNVLIHRGLALKAQRENWLKVQNIDKRVTGHLMCIRKGTWKRIEKRVQQRAKDMNILSVDTSISLAVLDEGLPVRLMQGVYVFHYYRLAEGQKRKSILT